MKGNGEALQEPFCRSWRQWWKKSKGKFSVSGGVEWGRWSVIETFWVTVTLRKEKREKRRKGEKGLVLIILRHIISTFKSPNNVELKSDNNRSELVVWGITENREEEEQEKVYKKS